MFGWLILFMMLTSWLSSALSLEFLLMSCVRLGYRFLDALDGVDASVLDAARHVDLAELAFSDLLFENVRADRFADALHGLF